MHPILLVAVVYSAFVLQFSDVLAATPLPAADLLAATTLLLVVAADGRHAVYAAAVVGLLSDVLHGLPLGVTAATAVLAVFLTWKPTHDESPVVRWTARAFLLAAVVLLPSLVGELLAGRGVRLAPDAVAAVLHTLAFVASTTIAWQIGRVIVHGTTVRRSRHGF